MAGYCGLLQGFLVSWRPPSGRAKDFESGRPGPAAPDVVDISSDEEEEEDDVSPPVARRLRFDDAADDGVCDLVLKKGESGGADGAGEDDGDCVVLDSDPDGAIAVADEDGAAESDGSSDELQIVAEKGQVACRDFPHPRHLCSNMPFGASTSHEKHCTMCYCFVCDAPAPCAYWGEGLLIDDHCHATDKETKWRTLRQEFKCKKLPTSHPEKENLVYPTMVRPTVMSVGRLSLANRSPLRNVVNQNQETHTSVRAQLIVEPTACAPSTARRAGCGTSNAHTGQITHLVEPTISAPRPHPVIRARSGTSNAHAAQVTRPLEPTVSAAMPHPAIRDGSVASNAHTAQITQPVHPTVSEPRANLVTRAARDTHNGYTSEISHRVEQTVSASRKYAATRAARHASNAHTAENTYPPTAFSYLSELDRHKEDGEYMTEEEYTRDGTKVYVGNLPYNIRNRALALSFEHAGAVLSSKVIYNRETGQSRGFGFVTMSTVQEAERAVRIYHGYELYDRRLIVRKVVPRGTAALRQESYQHEVDVEYTCEDDDELLEEAMVYVGNLHYDIDNLYLAELFEYAGTVEHAKVIYNRNTHQSRGFGFVTMSTVRQADRAMRIYHGYEVYGRRLSVHKAAHRTRGARVETPRRSANDNATLRSRGFRMFDTPRRRSVNNATPRSRGFHFRMGTPRRHSTNKAATPGSRSETPRRGCWHRFGIYVANLPWQVDDSWLEELFGGHGVVVDARVVCERRGGAWRSRGFGFVTMATEEATYDAVYALDKQILEGRTLLVEVAKERPWRGFY